MFNCMLNGKHDMIKMYPKRDTSGNIITKENTYLFENDIVERKEVIKGSFISSVTKNSASFTKTQKITKTHYFKLYQ